MLNTEQQQAVEHIATPLLVIAGAGSGKTSVITQKITHLIMKKQYAAKNIVAITFTNKAATEMLMRNNALLDKNYAKGLTICTFHALGLKIFKEEHKALNYKKTFSILDSYDSNKIIGDIINSNDKEIIKSLQNKISKWKNSLITAAQLLDNYQTTSDHVVINNMLDIDVFNKYQKILKTYQAVDFDDLLILPLQLLQQNDNILYKWQQKIQYLLIDEYQDTNYCQYELIKLLMGKSGVFTAVGDDDQSIYAWRGANKDNLLQLKTDFHHLHIIKLEQNYRSTNKILQIANNLITHNVKIFDKQLWSNLGLGNNINLLACKNDVNEAETVIKKIMLHKIYNHTTFTDYAILYRSNHQARILETVLREHQLPYIISGGSSFFEKTEIKDICAYLRLIINEDDDLAFIRAITTPKKGIGNITLEKLVNYATKRQISLFVAIFEEGFYFNFNNPMFNVVNFHDDNIDQSQLNNDNFLDNNNAKQLQSLKQFGELINEWQWQLAKSPDAIEQVLNDIIKAIKYEEYLYQNNTAHMATKRFANVMTFINWIIKKAIENHKTLDEIIHTINLINILDNQDKPVDAIKLSTLHAVKGLEYPYVYLIGCEEEILPHKESLCTNEQIEEERRLMYVGITRAKQELTISYCQLRKQDGAIQSIEPSRFIDELQLDIVNENIEEMSNSQRNTILKNKLQILQDMLQ